MAVNLTAAELAVELRVITAVADFADLPEGQSLIITRQLRAVTRLVTDFAPNAPDDVHDEAAARLAGVLFDRDAAEERRPAVAMRTSGAVALLGPYRKAQGLVLPSGTEGGATPAGDVSDWALADNADPIPTAKLSLAGGAAHDQIARDAAAAAQSDADAAGSTAAAAIASAIAAQRSADDALAAIAALDNTYSTDAERTAAVAVLQAAIDAIDGGGGTGTSGTRVYVETQQPTGGTYRLDDVWIRDVTTGTGLQIYKWTGSVWSVTYTLPAIPDVTLLSPGAALGTPSATDYSQNAVRAVDGQWFYVQQTGHLADTASWTWADLNDGMVDLAGWREIVAENPFSIPNPQALDWAYVANEQRWVRYASSTWQYQPAPSAFHARQRTQNAAQNSGLVTVGAFIFDHNKHAMRIIRGYNGAVPGAPTYAWHSFQGEALDLERWTFRNESIQVQARKLAEFPQNLIGQIANGGEQHFRLTARVHRNATGDLTSYDLAQWETVPATTTTPGGLTETVIATVVAAAGAGVVTYSGLALASGAPSFVSLNTVSNQPGIWYGIRRPAGALGWIVRTKIGNAVQGDTFIPWGSSAHEHASIEDVTGALVAAYWVPTSSTSAMVAKTATDLTVATSRGFGLVMDNGQFIGTRPATRVEFVLVSS